MNTKVVSFHGKQEIKDKYIDRLEQHYAAANRPVNEYWKQILQTKYFSYSVSKGRLHGG